MKRYRLVDELYLDNMSTLVSDTLVSRAEPPPSGWADITLEQTYEYWRS